LAQSEGRRADVRAVRMVLDTYSQCQLSPRLNAGVVEPNSKRRGLRLNVTIFELSLRDEQLRFVLPGVETPGYVRPTLRVETQKDSHTIQLRLELTFESAVAWLGADIAKLRLKFSVLN
jgi:hypothetical protein